MCRPKSLCQSDLSTVSVLANKSLHQDLMHSGCRGTAVPNVCPQAFSLFPLPSSPLDQRPVHRLRLLQLIYFVKCKRVLFEPNSYEPYSSSERERKFCRRLFTSSIKSEIRHFPSWLCSGCKEMYKKAWCTCRVVVFTIQPIAFLSFSLSSPSWHLKVPTQWFSSSSSEQATPNSRSYEQNGFQVCCRNK